MVPFVFARELQRARPAGATDSASSSPAGSSAARAASPATSRPPCTRPPSTRRSRWCRPSSPTPSRPRRWSRRSPWRSIGDKADFGLTPAQALEAQQLRRAGRRLRRPSDEPMRILALGGGLRERSRNRTLLDEAAALVRPGTTLDLTALAVVGSLPLFNQDVLERDGLPTGAMALKDALQAADGLLDRHARVQLGNPGIPEERDRLGVAPVLRRTGACSATCRSPSSGLAAGRARATHRRRGCRCSVPQDAAVVRPVALRRPFRGAVRPGQPAAVRSADSGAAAARWSPAS